MKERNRFDEPLDFLEDIFHTPGRTDAAMTDERKQSLESCVTLFVASQVAP